jgi:hypothetical protein
MLHAWERWEMHTKFRSENVKERAHLEDAGVDGKIILEWVLAKWGGMVQTDCIWPNIGRSGGLL